MRIVFMGTPEIARDVLKAVCEEHEVVGVFCQPDKPVGRKHIITPPPVKEFALEKGIPVFQPKGFKNGKAAVTLRELDPDLILVIAYGPRRSWISRDSDVSTFTRRSFRNTGDPLLYSGRSSLVRK